MENNKDPKEIIQELKDKIDYFKSNSLEHVIGHMHCVANTLETNMGDFIMNIIIHHIDSEDALYIIKNIEKMVKKLAENETSRNNNAK